MEPRDRSDLEGNARPGEVTVLLRAWRSGDAQAGDLLVRVLYRELHDMARRRLRGERPGMTLQTTSLVHETYLRLIDQRQVEWRDLGHFPALAATTTRRALVHRARASPAGKRGAREPAVTLTDAASAGVN